MFPQSSKVLRTFVAVKIPRTQAIDRLLDTLRSMDDQIRTIPSHQLHLTLKFLGDTPEDCIPNLRWELTRLAQNLNPIQCTLGHIGVFPNQHRPQVIWLGIHPTEPVVELATRIEETCETLGFPKEHRAYTPHITLARVRRRATRANITRFDSAPTLQEPLTIDHCILFQSDLQSDPISYTSLFEIPFAAS